jgi:hypothetical protein
MEVRWIALCEIKPPVAYQQHCHALLGICIGGEPLKEIVGNLVVMLCKKKKQQGVAGDGS